MPRSRNTSSSSPRRPLSRKLPANTHESGNTRNSSDNSYSDNEISGDVRSARDNSSNRIAPSRPNEATPQLSADETRKALGLRTEAEELREEEDTRRKIVELETELRLIQTQQSDEPVEEWRSQEMLEDDLEDAKYAVRLAEDRRMLTQVDEALRTNRVADSDRSLLEAMRHQYLNLIFISTELRQVELNRRSLRDIDDDLEEVIEPNGQIVLRKKGLGNVVSREPSFINPSLPGQSSLTQGPTPISMSAKDNLAKRVKSGLLPANLLITSQPTSGDTSLNQLVSTNVVRPGSDPASTAAFLGSNAAGGAIPIAIEQFDDQGVNANVLSQRAMNSAMFVIDPALLNKYARANLEIITGAGEFRLTGVESNAIVAIIVPAHGMEGIKSLAERPLIKVATVNREVAFNFGESQQARPTINHPDYETGLRQVLKANPGKTLLFHTTRLGGKDPIGK